MADTLAILNTIRDSASREYQERIPVASQTNFASVGQAISEYEPLYNEFLSNLINKIGKTYIEQKMFNNKLKRFKTGSISTGQDVEEMFIEMSKASGVYDSTGSNPLGRRTPPNVEVYYHRMNRQDEYCMTIGDRDFKRVFRSPELFNNFTGGLLNSIYSGAEYDEWIWFKKVLASYGHTPTYAITEDLAIDNTKQYFTQNADGETYSPVVAPVLTNINTYYEDTSTTFGYYDYQVAPITTADTAKAFVKTLRKAVQDVSFANTKFNSSGVKTWSNPEGMSLLLNKDVVAEVDVEVLAKAFNMGKTDIEPNIITMDDFGSMPNTYGILIDNDFFKIFDVLSHTESQRNAQGLFTNYFYHVHQILSASTFKNAVRLVKKSGT